MHNGSSECSKSNSIGHGKEGAQVESTLSLIRFKIKVEIRVYYGCDVINLTLLGEEFVGENGERFCMVHIQPIAEWSQNVHHKHESHGNVGGRKPWARQWASEVRGNGRPVQPNCSYTKPVQARPELMGQNVVGKQPAYPRERDQHLEDVSREDVVGEAAQKRHYKELRPR